MHVFEPKASQDSPTRIAQFSIILSLLIIVLLGGFAFSRFHKRNVLSDKNERSLSSQSTSSDPYTYLSGYDFQRLYAQTALPNSTKIIEPPVITGNSLADERMQKIAESRGFNLQSVPKQEVKMLLAPGRALQLQQLALAGWNNLEKLAQAENVSLVISGGLVDTADSRKVFIEYLNKSNLKTNEIAAGKNDVQIIDILQHVAPPGYARRHSGYTIAVKCAGESNQVFELSTCNKWLSDKNYLKAKQAGFIPAYIEGIGTPNTDPYSKELSWVGINNH